MRKIIIPLLCLLSCLAAHADISLWLEEHKGDKREFSLSERPKVTFSGKEIVLISGNTTIYLPLVPSVKFYFSDTGGVTTIDSDIQGAQRGSYRFVDGGLEVTLPLSNVQISLFNLQGVKHYSALTDNAGNAFLPTTGLQGGIYIVSSPDFQFKIAIK